MTRLDGPPAILVRKLAPKRRLDRLGVIPVQILPPAVEIRKRVTLSRARPISMGALPTLG
eukprot:10257722-Alexandrium_andersonii.AAC.1